MHRSAKVEILLGMLCLALFLWVMIERPKEESVTYELESEPVLAPEDSGKKVMYLTFDDGPSKYTEEVLKILKEADVKATFFVTNEFPDYVSLIKEEKKQGHAVGVHTYSHQYEKIYQNSNAYFSDIEAMQTIIQEQTGERTTILRFPGGSSNTVSGSYCTGIMSELSTLVLQQGYEYYDWNATNGDGNTGWNADTLIETAKKEIGSQPVVMLLMHDGGGNGETVKALPSILDYCKEQGYEFRVIDETTPQFHHHINN